MALRDLTKPELRKIIENANFTEDEMMVFQLSSNGSPIDYIADTMKISSSTVNRILRKIYKKIERIEDMSKPEVPIWQKVTMTIDEASAYSNIGTSRPPSPYESYRRNPGNRMQSIGKKVLSGKKIKAIFYILSSRTITKWQLPE